MNVKAVYPKQVRQNLNKLKKEIQTIENKLNTYDNPKYIKTCKPNMKFKEERDSFCNKNIHSSDSCFAGNAISTKIYGPNHVHHKICIPLNIKNDKLLKASNKDGNKATWNEILASRSTNKIAEKSRTIQKGRPQNDNEKRIKIDDVLIDKKDEKFVMGVVSDLQKELRQALADKEAAERHAAVCQLAGEKMKVLLEANVACSVHNARSVKDLERRLEEQLCLERRDAATAQVNTMLHRIRLHNHPHISMSASTSASGSGSGSSRQLRHSSPTASKQPKLSDVSWNDVSSIQDASFLTI